MFFSPKWTNSRQRADARKSNTHSAWIVPAVTAFPCEEIWMMVTGDKSRKDAITTRLNALSLECARDAASTALHSTRGVILLWVISCGCLSPKQFPCFRSLIHYVTFVYIKHDTCKQLFSREDQKQICVGESQHMYDRKLLKCVSARIPQEDRRRRARKAIQKQTQTYVYYFLWFYRIAMPGLPLTAVKIGAACIY